MTDTSKVQPFWIFRQPVSGFTHAAGALAAAIATPLVIDRALGTSPVSHLIAFGVFGASLTALMSSSAVYHLVKAPGRWVALLRRLDHMMIYVFIAGCYTPVCLITLGETGWGIWAGAIAWLAAITGIIVKAIVLEQSRWIRIGPYAAMGLMSLVILPEIAARIPWQALAWLITGGVAYFLGALVYALRRPDPFPSTFGFHEIWHLLVLAGGACHFWFMSRYILTG